MNEEIALELGYEKDEYGDWYSPTDIPLRYLPDFEHDWAHAGPLLEELVSELGWYKALAEIWAQITMMFAAIWAEDDSVSPSPRLKEAISLAWLAWKKEEHPKPEKKLSQTEGYMKLIMENDEDHPHD